MPEMDPPLDARTAVDALCPACGLCCNGVLFADVELSKGDDPRHLTGLGLSVGKKGRKLAFAQPCSCFDGKWCRAYAERPGRCRAFECRLLKRVAAGELTLETALRIIDQTLAEAGSLRTLLRRLGNCDEHLPLSRRFAQVMAQPIDLAGDDEIVELRARLMLECDQLMKKLQRLFLSAAFR